VTTAEGALIQDNEELRRRLEEAEDAIRALRAGEVDAIVVAAELEAVYTLEAADRTYRLLVEQMPQAAATLTLGGEILSCNRPFAELLGSSISELLHCPFQNHVASEHRTGIERLLKRSLAGEVEAALQLQCADGSRTPVFLRIAALREGALGQCLMVTDQTQQRHYNELRETQESLRAVSERLELAQAAGQIGIFEWDITGVRGVTWSSIQEKLFGLPPGGFGGRYEDWVGAIHPNDTKRFTAAVQRAVAERAPLAIEYRIVRPDGATRWLEAHAKVDCGADGEPQRMVGVTRDVTERKRAVTELERSNAEKDEFLATLAHELRNPLAPIRSAVELIRLGVPVDPELNWAREVIERQVQVMARLLEDLLDVSRLSRQRMELRCERVVLSAVFDAALETSRPLIESRQHTLAVLLPGEPIHLEGDPVRLAQVFSNLLNNAAKYTEKGGKIRLCGELRDDEVVVSVRDNGVGIPADAIPHIFEIFSQATPLSAQSRSGLGIGLSLVKGLVELHGGHVHVHCEGPKLGSEFVVHLPLSQAPAADTLRGSDREQPAGQDARRVLVVDDNRDSADSLARILALAGHSVHTAYNGEQALQVATEMRPDVVLLDLGMPRVDGYEACRRIRGEPWGREVFIIAVTGWGQEADRHRSAEAGFDVHLVKPVSPAKLRKLVTARSLTN
jgi:PAS domain S-box-containing protein